MSRILLVDDDPDMHRLVSLTLAEDGHVVVTALTAKQGMALIARESFDLAVIDFMLPDLDGLEFLEQARAQRPDLRAIMITGHGTPDAVLGALRRRVCDFLVKPFSVADLRSAVQVAFESCPMVNIEIVSATPNWVEMRIPCDLGAVPVLQKLLTQLKNDLPEETREAIAYAFREMLNNAIEHGGKLDPTKQVEVACIRTKRAIIYWIKDPGEGFDPSKLEHAAVNNPAGDPFRHVVIRDEKGLRAGGFGILLTRQLIDELVYNERRNELIFVKYL
jgi:CheY-like chemotaxis protein/anti-sigma regulatory factor (Ser/Thr protein kinase)